MSSNASLLAAYAEAFPSLPSPPPSMSDADAAVWCLLVVARHHPDLIAAAGLIVSMGEGAALSLYMAKGGGDA